jgi:hypothetical protein
MRPPLSAGPRHRRRPAPSFLAFGVLAAVVVTIALTGCYRRVVGVKGDASSYDGKVYEPNLKPGEDNVVKGLFETRTVRPVEDP